MKFALVFLGSLPRITGVGTERTPQQESLITLPRCVHFSIGKKRWKADGQGFPSLFSDWKADTTRQSYDRFLLGGSVP